MLVSVQFQVSLPAGCSQHTLDFIDILEPVTISFSQSIIPVHSIPTTKPASLAFPGLLLYPEFPSELGKGIPTGYPTYLSTQCLSTPRILSNHLGWCFSKCMFSFFIWQNPTHSKQIKVQMWGSSQLCLGSSICSRSLPPPASSAGTSSKAGGNGFQAASLPDHPCPPFLL